MKSGGRNINRYKPGGDWRWIKKGKMTKMSYFAFGRCQPNGADISLVRKTMSSTYDRKLCNFGMMFKVFVVANILFVIEQAWFYSKPHMNRSKIDTDGRYLPFYGFTIISMCDSSSKLAELYELIKSSRVAKYCQPLPLDSYHMTVYSIWNQNERLYPYQLKLANDIAPKKDVETMKRIMNPALDKMAVIIDTFSKIDKIKLQIIDINPGTNGLSIRVKIKDPEQNLNIQRLIKWLGVEFHDTKPGLKFHITLCYYFQSELFYFTEDILHLQRWIRKNLSEIVVSKPYPMFFRSMEKFIPYIDEM